MTNVEFAILFVLFYIAILLSVRACRDGKFQRHFWDAYEVLKIQTEHPLRIVSSQTKSEKISDALNSDDYLTADQVATMLQVSKTTIYTWAGSGYIPALKIRGGSQKNVWRFSRRDVEAWIAEQKQPVTVKDLFTRKENADADTSAGTERGSV